MLEPLQPERAKPRGEVRGLLQSCKVATKLRLPSFWPGPEGAISSCCFGMAGLMLCSYTVRSHLGFVSVQAVASAVVHTCREVVPLDTAMSALGGCIDLRYATCHDTVMVMYLIDNLIRADGVRLTGAGSALPADPDVVSSRGAIMIYLL